MPARRTINDMHERAAKRGGTCLSQKYVNAKTPLTWQCAAGHIWQQRPHDIATGRWCPTCAIESRKGNIGELCKLAAERGGKCLSSEYVNKRTKIRWQCREGHIWDAFPTPIKRGGWCPVCARKSPNRSAPRKHKFTIEDMQVLAAENGGICLSENYDRIFKKLTWQCEKGHIWETAPENIFKGAWCPVCRPRGHKQRLGIKEMQALAREKDGDCLSTEYVNTATPLRWRCAEGHEWEAAADNVKYSGTWCPYCSGKHNWSLEKLHEYAASHGGKCLANSYTRQIDPVEWECKDGHRWRRAPGSMLFQKQWCPKCYLYISEEICRAYFEVIWGAPFAKTRPKWLISPKGRPLELDGFNSDLRLAFEHHGQHHYYKGRFSETSSKLRKRLNYDEIKRVRCAENGVLLIEIPEIDVLLPLVDLKPFIKKQLIDAGRSLPAHFNTIEVDLGSIRIQGRLEELRSLANSKGGECLSNSWLGAKRRHRFRCSEGHEWEAQAYEVISEGTWCPTCYKNNRGKLALQRNSDKKLLRLQKVAEARGGMCLTDEWLGANEYHVFKCKEGHKWKAWANNVRRGTWCPQCAKSKRTEK